MKNQVDAMRNFSTDDDVAHFLNSSLTKTEINRVKKDVLSGRQNFFMLPLNHLQKRRILNFLKILRSHFMQLMKHIVFLNGDTISGLNTGV